MFSWLPQTPPPTPFPQPGLDTVHRSGFSSEVDSRCDSTLNISCRAKGFQHQRMTNGAMNVEIGNPAYKIYEGEPDDDAGELLDADFTLDPDKVKAKEPRHADSVRQNTGWV